MLSYLSSFLTKYWTGGREAAEMPMENIEGNSAPFSLFREIRADGLESIKGIGIITDIAWSYCRINDLYWFDRNAIVASASVANPLSLFNVGDKVEFEANKGRYQHCWNVTFVKRPESKLIQSKVEGGRRYTVVTRVKTVNRHYLEVEITKTATTLVITIPMSIVQRFCDIDWIVGDLLRIGVEYVGRGLPFLDRDLCFALNEQRAKIFKIMAVELKSRQGKVTRRKTMLFIDGEIYFPRHVGKPDANYSEGTLVNCTYIPSRDENMCASWIFRAISVEVIEKDTKKLGENPMVVNGTDKQLEDEMGAQNESKKMNETNLM